MKKKQNIWLLRLIPILCILVLIVSLSEIFYQSMIKSTTEGCWDELDLVREHTAEDIGSDINANIKLLSLAADAILMNVDLRDEASVIDYLTEIQKNTIYNRVDVIFPNDTILIKMTGTHMPNTTGYTFEDLVESGIHMSKRATDFLTKNAAVYTFAPVYDISGKAVAVLCATTYCSTFGDFFETVSYGDDARLFIVDRRDGNLILDNIHDTPGSIYDMSGYQSPDGEKDFITDIMSGASGRMSYTSKTYKTTSYSIYAPIANTDFSIVLVLNEDVVLADLIELKSTLMWVGIVELILIVLLGVWVYFIVVRSMENEKRVNEAELELLHKSEEELQHKYAAAEGRKEFLELMAVNLPGGYHRCTTDYSFKLTFISTSFTQVTGYTMKQLNDELDGSYMGIVLDEDREYFMSLAPALERDGHIHCSYRIRRRDGKIRWVQDTTQYVEHDDEHYYQCALMDITDQIEEIEHARQEAVAGSIAKSTFLFNISHDIRTPMNAINGFSHIISENADDPKLVRETADKLTQAGNSLMMLINDVLDISRIERGKEEINLQPMDLYEHGKNLYDIFASEMKAAGINFVVDGDDIHDYIYCDHLKLTRIMMNMLSNAKKFTPRGGTVTCGCTKIAENAEDCTYRFFVKDTGIGMSEEFKKRAFEQFEREHTSTETGIVGTGLGLAIIKMMVELMGGEVQIESELGKGTEISAILTFKRAKKEALEKDKANLSTADISGKRVLLVEDNAFNREIAKYILEDLNAEVDEAENGKICIDKLQDSPSDHYDFILMDIQMPLMDGYAATAAIRHFEDKQKASIPIIAMTANAFDEDRRKCLDVGMNGHIGKPINIQEFMKVISEVLK